MQAVTSIDYRIICLVIFIFATVYGGFNGHIYIVFILITLATLAILFYIDNVGYPCYIVFILITLATLAILFLYW